MAISRYWRLVGISTSSNGALELSECRIYENGVLTDSGAALTCTFAPTSGAMSDLRDGLATGVVSWPYADYSSAGFALVWDFGAGLGVEFPSPRLGAGSSALTFPLDVVMQSSSNGLDWATYSVPVVSILYPGNNTITSVPEGSADPYYKNVSLLLHGGSTNGFTTFTDSSSSKKTTTAAGNAQISTAQSKFGGSSCLFDGTNDYVSVPSSTDFDFGTGNFTIECWFYITSNANFGSYPGLIVRQSGGTYAALQWAFNFQPGGGLGLNISDGTTWLNPGGVTGAITVGVWHHVALVRSGTAAGDIKVYLDGVLSAASTSNPSMESNTASAPIGLGGGLGGSAGLIGYVDELRITKGIARYTANFTPPIAAFPDLSLLQTDTPAPSRSRQLAPTPDRLLPAVELPDTAAQCHAREHAFFDAYNGGIGIITGTVKEKNTPSNTPLYRRVLLVDERSQIAIREIWSDAVTGDYEFRGIKQGIKYTVISYDHLHNYRAVIADNQDAT